MCICIFFQPPALSSAIAFCAPLSNGITSAWMPTWARLRGGDLRAR